MRIMYVAKHGSGGNDDEGAIAYALQQLGHEVDCVKEGMPEEAYVSYCHDLCLFHKWMDLHPMQRAACHMPLAFWYFDLVWWPECAERSYRRIQWMDRVMPLVLVGFCTDGDFAARFPEKLVHLPQGADERIVGMAEPSQCDHKLLLTASPKGGAARQKFCSDIRAEYGSSLLWSPSGLHGLKLRKVTRTGITLCPDSPITDRYWSNRVYIAAGFGGLVLHPLSFGLGAQFQHGRELLYYGSRRDMYDKVQFLQETKEEYRLEVRLAALRRVQAEHLYRHRCGKLIAEVQRRMGSG